MWASSVAIFLFALFTLVYYWDEWPWWATALNIVGVVAAFLYPLVQWRQKQAPPDPA